jgi:4-oxalocrotonate tautomerase
VDVTWFEGRSAVQKHDLAAAICQAFVQIGDARPDSVHVIFRDLDRGQWFKSADILDEGRP